MAKQSQHGGQRTGSGRKSNESKGIERGKPKQFILYPADIDTIKQYKPKVANALVRGFIRDLGNLSETEKHRLIMLGDGPPT